MEGMAIAGYAIGAGKGYIYLRAEYHYLLEGLQKAIDQSKEKGYLKDLEIEITGRCRGLYLRGGVGPHELHRRETG